MHLLDYADLTFVARFSGSGRLPAFRGATLRGAFGYALKRSVCIVRHGQCERCLLRARCAYPVVFEGVPPQAREFMRKYPYVPQPMLFRVLTNEPEQVGPDTPYEFAIRLFGPAIEFFPYAVFAVLQMGERGLGRGRLAFTVERVLGLERELGAADLTGALPPPIRTAVELPAFSDSGTRRVRVRLRFVTPIRLRIEGQISNKLSFRSFMAAAVRRLRILTHFYGNGADQIRPAAAFDAVDRTALISESLRTFAVKRRSQRQQTEMNLSGLIGEMVFDTDSALLPWLYAASACHVGKATSFGFGRLAVEVIDS